MDRPTRALIADLLEGKKFRGRGNPRKGMFYLETEQRLVAGLIKALVEGEGLTYTRAYEFLAESLHCSVPTIKKMFLARRRRILKS